MTIFVQFKGCLLQLLTQNYILESSKSLQGTIFQNVMPAKAGTILSVLETGSDKINQASDKRIEELNAQIKNLQEAKQDYILAEDIPLTDIQLEKESLLLDLFFSRLTFRHIV